jgi:hypothetical protein
VSIESAVRYPSEADDWLRTVVIGGVLALLGVFVLPVLLSYGYVLDVFRAGVRDDPEPPTFRLDEWPRLLVEGAVAAAVVLVYQLLPLVVLVVVAGGVGVAALTGSEALIGLSLLWFAAGLLVWTALTVLFGYLSLAGVAAYADTDRVGAAFDLDVLRDVALDREFAVCWLYGVVLLVLGGALGALLAPLGTFVGFYAQIAAARLWGRGYARSRTGTGATGAA